MRTQAVFNGAVIAVSNNTVVMEGNDYFPLESVRQDYLTSMNNRRRRARALHHGAPAVTSTKPFP